MRNLIIIAMTVLMFVCSTELLAQTTLDINVVQTIHNGSGLDEVNALAITDDGQ